MSGYCLTEKPTCKSHSGSVFYWDQPILICLDWLAECPIQNCSVRSLFLSDRCSRGPDPIPVDHILLVGWIKLHSSHYAPFNSVEPSFALPNIINFKASFSRRFNLPSRLTIFRLFLNNNPRQSLILTLFFFFNYGEVIGLMLDANSRIIWFCF